MMLSGKKLDSAWSDYLVWLTFAVPGMLDRRNIDAMSYALRHLPTGAPILEIGSFCGLSTCVLAYLKGRHAVANPLFTCDRWSFEGQVLGAPLVAGCDITHDEYKGFIRDSFIRNVKMFSRGELPQTIEADSDSFFALWGSARAVNDVFDRPAQLGGPLAFCYIDGNHSYPFARRDFENTDRFLVSGGFVLFDDSGDQSGWEVCRVVEEVVASGRYDVISHDPNYLLRKK